MTLTPRWNSSPARNTPPEGQRRLPRSTRAALLLTAAFLLGGLQADALAGPPQYHLWVQLGNGGIPGVMAPGDIYDYGWTSTPQSASGLVGCQGGWGSCVLCGSGAPKYEGTGGGYTGAGTASFSLAAIGRCQQAGEQAGSVAITNMVFDDVVFSGPGSGSILVSLNLDVFFDVTWSPSWPVNWPTATLDIQTPGGNFYSSGSDAGFTSAIGSFVEGAPFSFTTGQFSVPLNTPWTLSLQFSGGVSGASPISSVNATMNLALGTGVFNLPAGVTVDSPSAGIVNNVWQPGPVSVEETSWGRIKSLYESRAR